MASSKAYLDFILEQLSDCAEITSRAMMGEYILYAESKVFGGIYDDRLLVKPVPAAKALLPNAKLQLPYDGAKPMLRITDEQIADKALLAQLTEAMLQELPSPAKKK